MDTRAFKDLNIPIDGGLVLTSILWEKSRMDIELNNLLIIRDVKIRTNRTTGACFVVMADDWSPKTGSTKWAFWKGPHLALVRALQLAGILTANK